MRFNHANQLLYLPHSWTQALCEAAGFFKRTNQAGPAKSSGIFLSMSHWNCLGYKTNPSNKAVFIAETQGSTLPGAENHHSPHQRDFLHPAVPRDLAAEDYMPSSAASDRGNPQFPVSVYRRGKDQRSIGQVGRANVPNWLQKPQTQGTSKEDAKTQMSPGLLE